MQQLIQAHLAAFVALAVVYLLTLLAAHKSQADAWCMQHPRVAGFLKIVRGFGIDPWLIIQGVTLMIKARLPNYLLKILPVALVCSLLLGCGNMQEKINSAIEFESKVQVEAQAIADVARAAIVLLPPEKQADAYKALSDASTAFAVTIAAKSDALQAINAGLSSDWGTLAADIAACAQALEALGKIILSFGADPVRVNAAMVRVATAQGFTVARLSK
jgi:hypothetical protein